MRLKRVTCSVSPELAEGLERRAARAGKSLNQFLRIILEAWAEKNAAVQPPAPEASKLEKSHSGGWGWL
jgi:hypothetical protein